MNIKPIEAIQSKQPMLKRIKNAFNKRFASLKELVSDVFEKNTTEKFYIHEGKKLRCHSSKFQARELPNSVTGPTDWQGCIGGRIVFSNDDQKIIDSLPADDAIKYMGKLIDEGKYKFPQNRRIDLL